MAKRSSALSRHEVQPPQSDVDTTEPVWVRSKFDILNPPPLTDEQREQLQRLANIRDEDIDTSDIPVLGEEAWKNGIRNPYYARAFKEQLTIRLDADILDWFKRHAKDGKGYQTDINKALRAYVVAQERRAAKKAG
jgi:uncharacterized protein (DUF4415 family)